MSGRFDYVKYDEPSIVVQESFKKLFLMIETGIDEMADGRSKSLALTALEETYTWIGKAIRDDQIARERTTT